MYQKILVPLDGSEFSECVLGHVRAVATGCKVPKVVLLRVVKPLDTQIAYDVPENFLREVQEKAGVEFKDYLVRLADNLKQDGIVAETAVVEGQPAEEILDYAGKNQVDLIGMSTHGRSGVSRWTFGSVADKVIRQSAVPVLVVSPPGCRIGESRG